MCCLQFTGSNALLFTRFVTIKAFGSNFMSPNIWFKQGIRNFWFLKNYREVFFLPIFFGAIQQTIRWMKIAIHGRLQYSSNTIFAQWNNSQIENCVRFHNSGKWKVNLYAKYERIGSGRPSKCRTLLQYELTLLLHHYMTSYES